MTVLAYNMSAPKGVRKGTGDTQADCQKMPCAIMPTPGQGNETAKEKPRKPPASGPGPNVQANMAISVVKLGLDELAVQAGDVGYRLVLGALGLAGAGVGAVAEAQLLHLHDHGLGTLGGLGAALGQQR